jgi:hypothetical protein
LGIAVATDAANDGPTKDPQLFLQENSYTTAQGQQLVNTQPMEKQQLASRPGSAPDGGQK